MTDPYAKTTHGDKTVDVITKAALRAAEKKLGYELTIVQGSYNEGVSASAGTHDGGGVVDLAPYDHARKVRVLRDLGFAAWYRPAIKGLWGPHIHAVLIGNARLAPSAARQVLAYRAGRDGLAANRPDPNPYRPNPIPVFRMPQPPTYPNIDAAGRSLDAVTSKNPKVVAAVKAALKAIRPYRRRKAVK